MGETVRVGSEGTEGFWVGGGGDRQSLQRVKRSFLWTLAGPGPSSGTDRRGARLGGTGLGGAKARGPRLAGGAETTFFFFLLPSAPILGNKKTNGFS